MLMPYLKPFWHFIVKKYLHQKMVYLTIANFFAIVLQYNSKLRASVLKNAILSYFTIPKSYFINYTIPFYNTSYIQKLYYFTFSLKYYFFNFSLLFLSHHHFFSDKGWNKIYIYIFFSIVLQYNSKFTIVL